jgi:hypothetical protein
MKYAFLDEFGGVSQYVEQDRYLIVAALITDSPRQLDLLISRARRRFETLRSKSELKATHSSEQITRWMLSRVASLDVSLIVVIQDKLALSEFPKQPEDLYRQTVARTIRHCVDRWPLVEFVIDKRYTQEHLRTKLEWRIRSDIADIPGQTVLIRQADSQTVKGLQVVDYVAWAAGQKYLRKDGSYLDLVKTRVVIEEVVVAK